MFIRRINVILSREFYRHYSDLSMIIIQEVRDGRLLITTGLSMLRVVYKPMTIKIDTIRAIRENILRCLRFYRENIIIHRCSIMIIDENISWTRNIIITDIENISYRSSYERIFTYLSEMDRYKRESISHTHRNTRQ